MKRLSIILLLLSSVLMANALDKRQTQINTIKKSKEYLFSDITMSTLDEAASQAFDELQMEILIWAKDRAQKEIGNVSPREINKHIDTIVVRRAEMYRVFAYVEKVKLVPVFSDWNLVLLDDLDCDPNHKDRSSDSVSSLLTPDSRFLSPDSCHQTPSNDSLVNHGIRDILKKNFLSRKGGVIDQIKKAKNFFELKEIMEPLKEKGDIIGYGKYATAENPEDCYLIVYDAAGNIKAFLGKGEEVRRNLKTGKDDSIRNYRGCGAIWFTMKD